MWWLFEPKYVVIFVIIGIFVFFAVSELREWNQNNHSPRLTVDAQVVAKRTSAHRHHHHHGTGAGHMIHTSVSTSHYVTFQVESGDRMEFHVNGVEYWMLAEGDFGSLTFQGTRYLGFEHQR